jgi:hypothetical protein
VPILKSTWEKIARASEPPIKLKCERPLTYNERISVRSAALAICRHEVELEQYGRPSMTYRYTLLTGLSIGAHDWAIDLPKHVERYISRYGCHALTKSVDRGNMRADGERSPDA